MLITWHGHSEFLLEAADGYRVLTDPFDDHVGYPMRGIRADAVTVSHGHGDHSYTAKVQGQPMILNAPGTTRLTPQVSVRSIQAYHDDAEGTKRGTTLLTVIEMDGLRIAHLGDLGCLLTPEQTRFLSGTDLLMVPVGGYFTIDGPQAAELVRALSPRVVLPMHYKTRFNSDWPISDEKPFYTAWGKPAPAPAPILRVTREDIECCASSYLFEVCAGQA